jgi:hypothetical protein
MRKICSGMKIDAYRRDVPCLYNIAVPGSRLRFAVPVADGHHTKRDAKEDALYTYLIS